jgi:tetratricopeptide (TPR) repeat protein
MKYLFTLLAIFSALCSSEQTIKKGDNLQTEYKKISKPYFFNAPNFTGWAEGSNMFFIGTKPNANKCDFLFIALKDTTLIGVFKIGSSNVFLFDTEGNSILSTMSEFFFLPLWTVKKKTKLMSSDKTILSLLDRMYEKTLQANELELDEKTIREYRLYQTDTSLSNRHIALLFDNYQNIITETAAKGEKAPAEICIPLMKSLSEECLSLYKIIPVIVCVYMGEALQSAGMEDKAREHFKMALQFYPNSIPLLVYNYRFEQDAAKKNEQLTELKKKYSKHWMVKDL